MDQDGVSAAGRHLHNDRIINPRSPRMTLADWVVARPVSISEEFNGPTPGPDPDDAERHTTNERHLVDWTCSVCGHPLGEHVVDHSEGHTIFECPVDDMNGAVLPEALPLNEVGQPKRV